MHMQFQKLLLVSLPQSKQRRTAMEDKYGGCMREMDSLIDKFRAQIISKDKDPSETSTTIKGMEKRNHESTSKRRWVARLCLVLLYMYLIYNVQCI